MNPIVVVPARFSATRLPGKPLADIAGTPMIVHVWRRAVEADCGPVLVATDHHAIADAVRDAGGRAILTRSDHPSGTDRIAEALALADPDRAHDTVLNLQGDLPDLSPGIARATLDLLAPAASLDGSPATLPGGAPSGSPNDASNAGPVHLGTAICRFPDHALADTPNAVKCVATALSPTRFRALYFTRAVAPWGEGPLFEHIGLYAWRRDAFDRFAALPPSPLERRERLEQLRALEAGMRIDAVLVDQTPIGVDTPDDLDRARARMAG